VVVVRIHLSQPHGKTGGELLPNANQAIWHSARHRMVSLDHSYKGQLTSPGPFFTAGIRLLTGHALTGEYNARHRPRSNDPHHCQCSEALQMAHHVITSCPSYAAARRAHSSPPFLIPFPLHHLRHQGRRSRVGSIPCRDASPEVARSPAGRIMARHCGRAGQHHSTPHTFPPHHITMRIYQFINQFGTSLARVFVITYMLRVINADSKKKDIYLGQLKSRMRESPTLLQSHGTS
jgi:hypothetical protein